MKTTQILSVMLTVIFIIVRFALLAVAVVTVRSPMKVPQRVEVRRGAVDRTNRPGTESVTSVVTP